MSESDSDLMDSLIKRAQERTPDRLEQQMHNAGTLKEQEEMASQRRLEEMWFREHDRQKALAEAQAEQKRQEDRLVRYVLIGAGIVLMGVILFTVVVSLIGG